MGTTINHQSDSYNNTNQEHTPTTTSSHKIFTAIRNTEKHQFTLSHPKNYLGVPLAISSSEPVEFAVPQKLVKMAGEAASGAESLGLITRDKQLTQAGDAFVTAITETQTPDNALDSFADTTQSRLIESIKDNPLAVQQVIARYPPVRDIITILTATGQLSLPELVEYALKNNYTQLTDYLLANTEEKPTPDDANTGLSDATTDLIERIDGYTATATYQFKSICFHAGILTTTGSDTTNLSPQDDIWSLSPHLNNEIQQIAIRTSTNGGTW